MPKTDKTNHYIGKNMFSLMKKECVFMNVGRGSTVDENEVKLPKYVLVQYKNTITNT